MQTRAKLFIVLAGLTLMELAAQRLGCAISVGAPCFTSDHHPRWTVYVVCPIIFLMLLASLEIARTGWSPLRVSPARLPWLAGAMCLLTGFAAGTFWPSSGDEHSYTFLADTLLAGRLTNPPPPDLELFKLFRVFTIDGKTFSQYPPGWPLVLAPFRAAALDWLANPLLTVLLGYILLGAMRRLQIAPQVQAPALLFVLVSPFVLFNGGSMFSHMLSAVLASAIVLLQLADEQQSSTWRKPLIGALFGFLLSTRYEVFAILAGLFAADRLWYRRGFAFLDAAPILLGFLPFGALFLGYNWAVTGNPFQTPAALTNPDMTFQEAIGPLPQMVRRAAHNTLYWTALLGIFGGFTLAVLHLLALVNKFRSCAVRFFDLALPITIIFFCYFPNPGGHQFGPRYWFFAWALAILTIVTGLVTKDGTFRLGASRNYVFSGLVAANLAICTISLPWLIVITRVYIDERRAVFAETAPVTPAIVLVPSRMFHLWPWPRSATDADSRDFARNDVDFSNPVLYGRLDAPDAMDRACRLPSRAVFEWHTPGSLVRAACPAE